MSPITKIALLKFVEKANWSTPASTPDLERFWDFVISAYRHLDWDISLDDFLDFLKRESDEERLERSTFKRKRELASKMFMFTKYEEGIKLLRKFENR